MSLRRRIRALGAQRGRSRTLISAHRGGVGADVASENTRGALERAVELDCEYVEFDVQRCSDGTFVLCHDEILETGSGRAPVARLTLAQFHEAAPGCLEYEEALQILRGRKRAHIDFKFVSPEQLYGTPSASYEVEAIARAVDVMGADEIMVSSLEDDSVKAIRAWSRERYPGLLVGLSLGRDLSGLRRRAVLAARWGELFPRRRILACDANLVVASKTLARLSLERFATRQQLPMLVWTVNDPKYLRRWVNGRRPWMATTDYPRQAAWIRDEQS